MKIVIHDLDKNVWEKISDKYKDYEVISDDGNIKPCIGCFGCWIKTPNCCVIKDGYENLGKLLARAEKIVVITKYTFGGFSSFIKNVLDRSISSVLPFFEIVNGQMHHKKRYKNINCVLEVLFYKDEKKCKNKFTDEQKEDATKYLKAVSVNLKKTLKDVYYYDSVEEMIQDINDNEEYIKEKIEKEEIKEDVTLQEIYPSSTLLVNCSKRGIKANSYLLLKALEECLIKVDKQNKLKIDIVNIVKYTNSLKELINEMAKYENIVFSMPLYIDGFPSNVVYLLEKISKAKVVKDKNIILITNLGFYECEQASNITKMVRQFTKETNNKCLGTLSIGAGEMIGPMISKMPMTKGPIQNAGRAIMAVAGSIINNLEFGDIYVGPYKFPRCFYMMLANLGWIRQIKENGLKKKDLYRKD